MSQVFNPPPNWPPPPSGWTPPPGWQPDPAWGPVPEGWQLWSPEKVPVRSRAERNRATNKKTLTVLGIVVGVVVLVGGAAAALGGGDDEAPAPSAAAPTAAPSTSAAPSPSSSSTSALTSTPAPTTEDVVTAEDLAEAMDTWWFEQGGYFVPVAASALDTYVAAVAQGDALAAANACLALDEAVGGIFNPVGLSSIVEPIPDEALQETLSIARSQADDAAEGCQDGLSDGDAIALSESLTDAADAYAGLSAVYEGVFTTYVQPALGR